MQAHRAIFLLSRVLTMWLAHLGGMNLEKVSIRLVHRIPNMISSKVSSDLEKTVVLSQRHRQRTAFLSTAVQGVTLACGAVRTGARPACTSRHVRP